MPRFQVKKVAVLGARGRMGAEVCRAVDAAAGQLIVREAGVERAEAFRALNMGVGFLFIVPAGEREAALSALRGVGEAPWVIGEMEPGAGVTLAGLRGAGPDGASSR